MSGVSVTSEQILPREKLTIEKLASKEPMTAAFASNCMDDSTITAAELSATRDNGPFTVASKPVPRQLANGFGGSTIHYPTNAGDCSLLGGIAVIPGYMSYESSIKW